MIKQVKFDKHLMQRKLCQESYFDFCQLFWHTVIAEEPVWNWHMPAICNAVQRVCELVFQMKHKEADLIINVPPGSSKSTLCSILLLPWCWTRMPSLRMIGGSFDHDLSCDLGNKSRRVVQSKLYHDLFPEIAIRSDQDTKSYYANYQGGERRATSTGASIIGKHAHLHVVDDPINPAGIKSVAELKRANDWLRETLPTRCVDQSITPQILVMQRLGLEDPVASRMNMNTGVPYRHYCFPAELSEDVRPKKYRHKYKDGLFDPKRYPRKVLDIKKVELGDYGYAGQFEQRPIPLSGGMFLWEKVIIERAPHQKKFDSVIRFWDKAATADGEGAYTSGVLMGRLRDDKETPRYWVLDVIRGRWDTHTREKIIRQAAKMDRALYGMKYQIGMEQEPGSGGKDSVNYSIRALEGFKVYAERPTGDKFERAMPFSTQVNAGNLGVGVGEWNTEYLQEMKFFGPTCKYKDQIDASSGGFNRLSRKINNIGAGGF